MEKMHIMVNNPNRLSQDDINLLVDVATRYYLKEETQQTIANELYISRPTVSRLLKRAKEEGIVNIRIDNRTDKFESLWRELVRKYRLDNAYIAITLPDAARTLEETTKLASDVLYDNLHDGCRVAISWGRSVRQTVKYLRRKNLKNTIVADMFGAVNYDNEDSNSHAIGMNLSEKIGAKFFPIPAPLFVKDEELKNSLLNTPIMKKSMEVLDNIDLLITGISSLESVGFHNIWDIYLEEDVKSRVRSYGAVGFMCARFFDEKGKFLDIDINRKIIGIDEKLIKEKRVMCISTGADKIEALKTALSAGLIDILVCDEETAANLLQ